MTDVSVAKFGGSSLADAAQFQKVISIVRADEKRRYIIPSAPGKRHAKDNKITDLLYTCYRAAITGHFPEDEFGEICTRYQEIIAELHLTLTLESDFRAIRKNLQADPNEDFLASRGEYLNAKILAAALDFTFLDAAEVVRFRADGTFDDETTNQLLSKRLAALKNAVIPGFYGTTPDGKIKTFSRGGSDITGSLVARAADAALYENFTDVSGFLMADPRIVANPEVIRVITYHELRELSYMGATVLHEDAIFPVRRAGIPINIRNTNAPEEPGTMILAEAEPDPGRIITGIAGKRGFTFISIEKDMMNNELGFGRRVLQVLENNGVSFEHLPSSIDTMSVVVSDSALENKKQKLLDELCATVEPDHINLEDGFALIAVVGRGMIRKQGTASRVFSAVAQSGINIHLIDQGSSEMNIILGVKSEDFENAMRVIYSEFH